MMRREDIDAANKLEVQLRHVEMGLAMISNQLDNEPRICQLTIDTRRSVPSEAPAKFGITVGVARIVLEEKAKDLRVELKSLGVIIDVF